MKAVGVGVLVVGLAIIFYALLMDVTVSSRFMSDSVNNIGLMSKRLMFVVIGSAASVVGSMLIAIDFTGQLITGRVEGLDHREYPFCSEQIKSAALKCKHCGTDVMATAVASAAALGGGEGLGWVVIIPASNTAELDRRMGVARELGLEVVSGSEMPILCGYYDSRSAAEQICQKLSAECGINAQTKYIPT